MVESSHSEGERSVHAGKLRWLPSPAADTRHVRAGTDRRHDPARRRADRRRGVRQRREAAHRQAARRGGGLPDRGRYPDHGRRREGGRHARSPRSTSTAASSRGTGRSSTTSRTSIECGVDAVAISMSSSDIHIEHKLRQSREWVLESVKKAVLLRQGAQPLRLGQRRGRLALGHGVPAELRPDRPRRRRRPPALLRHAGHPRPLQHLHEDQDRHRRHAAWTSRCTRTTTSAWPPPTPSPASGPAPASSTPRSTAWASAPATRRSKRWSWPSTTSRASTSDCTPTCSASCPSTWRPPRTGRCPPGSPSWAPTSSSTRARTGRRRRCSDPSTYEVFPPEAVGLQRGFILGKYSGVDTLRIKLDEHGIHLADGGGVPC